MDSALNTLMLICAVAAALAAGVLLGYATCKGLFALFTLHARSLVEATKTSKPEPQIASA
jgi:hypothetical protein